LNDNFELSETFRVPCLKEGRMVRLLSQLSKKEEEMFRNMVQRLNTLVQVIKCNIVDLLLIIQYDMLSIWLYLLMFTFRAVDCFTFGCTYNGRCGTNVFPTGHIQIDSRTDAEVQYQKGRRVQHISVLSERNT